MLIEKTLIASENDFALAVGKKVSTTVALPLADACDKLPT